MYKILLVDDEKDVLDAMVKIVAWNEFGFDTPVACRDGREAIAVLDDGFTPHVIITDISMPFVNGLEVADYAKENLPNTIVILLSGYDDFAYAQKAVQMKVHEYILKPVTPKSMNELLSELSAELNSRLNLQKDSEGIMKTHFLNQLLSLRMDKGTINEGVRENNLQFAFTANTVMVLDVDLPEPADISARKNLELMRYALLNVCQELAEEHKYSYLFVGTNGTVKCIVGGKNTSDCLNSASEFAELISKTFFDGMNITVSCGIGDPVTSLEDLYNSHSQGTESLSNRFYTGKGSISLHRDVFTEEPKDIEYRPFEAYLLEAVKDFNEDKTINIIHDMTAQLKKQRPSFDRCILHCQKLMTTLMKTTRELVGSGDIVELEAFWDTINFYSVFSIKQLEELMVLLCKRTFVPLNLIQSNPATVQMIKAEQYIKDNYADPNLSLNAITEFLSVSTSYFSTNFKSRTGSTFVEYITRIRMEKAKEILAHTNNRTYEVAYEVGYSDPHYFSSSFKKAVGVSPKEYRETHSNSRDKK